MEKLFTKISNSIMNKKYEAMEIVSKRILNVYGYPNSIEVFYFHYNNDCQFVDISTGEIVAKIEMKNFCFYIWFSAALHTGE